MLFYIFLQQLSVKGGVNKIIEYTGEGLKRIIINRSCNYFVIWGAELGGNDFCLSKQMKITKRILNSTRKRRRLC